MRGYDYNLFAHTALPGDYLPRLDWSLLEPGLASANVSLDGGTLSFNLEPVPEPSAWALTSGGLGVLLVQWRRRVLQ